MMEATTMEEVWQQDERSGTVAEPAVVNAAPLPPEEVQTMTMGTADKLIFTVEKPGFMSVAIWGLDYFPIDPRVRVRLHRSMLAGEIGQNALLESIEALTPPATPREPQTSVAVDALSPSGVDPVANILSEPFADLGKKEPLSGVQSHKEGECSSDGTGKDMDGQTRANTPRRLSSLGKRSSTSSLLQSRSLAPRNNFKQVQGPMGTSFFARHCLNRNSDGSSLSPSPTGPTGKRSLAETMQKIKSEDRRSPRDKSPVKRDRSPDRRRSRRDDSDSSAERRRSSSKLEKKSQRSRWDSVSLSSWSSSEEKDSKKSHKTRHVSRRDSKSHSQTPDSATEKKRKHRSPSWLSRERSRKEGKREGSPISLPCQRKKEKKSWQRSDSVSRTICHAEATPLRPNVIPGRNLAMRGVVPLVVAECPPTETLRLTNNSVVQIPPVVFERQHVDVREIESKLVVDQSSLEMVRDMVAKNLAGEHDARNWTGASMGPLPAPPPPRPPMLAPMPPPSAAVPPPPPVISEAYLLPPSPPGPTTVDTILRPLIDSRYGSEEPSSTPDSARSRIGSGSHESVSEGSSVCRGDAEPASATSGEPHHHVPVRDIFDGSQEQRVRNSLRKKSKIKIKSKEKMLEEKFLKWGESRLTEDLLQEYVALVDPKIYLTEIPGFQAKFDRMVKECASALHYLEFFLAESSSHVEQILLQKGIGNLFLSHMKLLKDDSTSSPRTAGCQCLHSVSCDHAKSFQLLPEPTLSQLLCPDTVAYCQASLVARRTNITTFCGQLADKAALYCPRDGLPVLLCTEHIKLHTGHGVCPCGDWTLDNVNRCRSGHVFHADCFTECPHDFCASRFH